MLRNLLRPARWLLMAGLLASMPVYASDEEWLLTVQDGDTLISIGQRYLQNPASWSVIAKLNNVPNPRRLQPGSTLRIPVPLLKRQVALAEVIRIKGDAAARSLDGGAQTLLAVGSTLRERDQISTRPNSNLTLKFVDGSRLLVLERSRVTLETLRTYGSNEVADTRVRLEQGQLDTQVNKLKGPAARYQITTPTMVLGVRGTNFRVATSEQGDASRSEVTEGLVAANGAGQEVALPAGFGTLTRAGQPPATPRRLLPAPVMPAASTRHGRLPLTFEWSPVDGATGYHTQVFADEDFDQLLIDSQTNQPHAIINDLPDGRYLLRVRAIDPDGLEGLNAISDFTVKARPLPPVLSQPAAGDMPREGEVEFRWHTAAEASAYVFQLSPQADFRDQAITLGSLRRPSVRLSLQAGNYYWRVASLRDGTDQGPFSDARQLTLAATPAKPQLTTPTLDSKHLHARWSAAAEPGQQYQVQLASDSAFTKLLVDRINDQPELVLDRPAAGTYYLRVKTIDKDGHAGPFASVEQVTVPQPRQTPWWLLLIALPFAL